MSRTRELAELATAYDTGTPLGMRNRIINGGMVIDQRNNGASVTPVNLQYSVDRFGCELSQASKYSVQQNAGAVTPPAGFTNYLGTTSLSAYSSLSTDSFTLFQRIEGHNVSDLNWGTASAQAVTLSFWVRSSLTGTFGGSLRNNAADRSYVFSYTVNASNTWEQKSITISGDTSGTWLTTSGTGVNVFFDIGSGANLKTTAGAWSAGNFKGVTGGVSVVGTNGATFYITGVQLEAGSVATPFERRPYGTELALCQRYFQIFRGSQYLNQSAGAAASTGLIYFNKPLMVEMRAAPTFSSSGTFHADGTTYTLVTLSMPDASTATVRLNGTGSGFTGGQAYMLTHQTTNSSISFSAEL